LFLHGDSEEDDEIQDKDRPEYWDVEEIKHCTHHANQQRLQRAVPTGPQHCSLVQQTSKYAVTSPEIFFSATTIFSASQVNHTNNNIDANNMNNTPQAYTLSN